MRQEQRPESALSAQRAPIPAAVIRTDSRPFADDGHGLFTDLKIERPCRISSDRASTCTNAVGAVEALSRPSVPVRRLLDLAGRWSTATVDGLLQLPTYRTAKRLTSEELDALVAAYRAGDTVYVLAARFGINRKTVGKHLRAHGVDTTPPGIQPEDVPAAAELYEAGQSLVSIAERFGVSAGTIQARLVEAGVAMRKPWERKVGRS